MTAGEPEHVHTQDQFTRSYRELTGTYDAKGKPVTRPVMVWGCPCGKGPTRETR